MGKEIGIDLGTTNTVVSYVNKRGLMRSLKYGGQEIIPSVIYFLSKTEFEIGDRAKKRLLYNPAAGMEHFKTKLGSSEKYTITAENGDVFRCTARKIATLFLERIAENIETRLIKEFGPADGCIGNVVITVPAKFNDAEKGAVKRAAKDAGFEIVKLAAEPTAAAVAYRQEQDERGKTILVYDFGGGTFDVSIIREAGQTFHELATGGDKHLGGNEITRKLAEQFLEQIEDAYGLTLPLDEEDFDEEDCGLSYANYRKNLSAVLEEANNTKEALSEEDSIDAQINLLLPDGRSTIWECPVEREDFEALMQDNVQRTIDIMRSVMQESEERGAPPVERIVLAGGSSKLPLVRRMMQQNFQMEQVYDEDVHTLISRGAAYLAREELDSVTNPITSIQYGVALTDGVLPKRFQTIIPENQPLPYTARYSFYLNRDGQTRIEIPYYERDIKNYPQAVRADQDGITEIDTLILSNLPEGLQKSDITIEVTFTLQKEGTLAIRADVKDQTGRTLRDTEVVCERSSNLE